MYASPVILSSHDEEAFLALSNQTAESSAGWIPEILHLLSDPNQWAYRRGGTRSTEPAAVAAAALAGHGMLPEAEQACAWLAELQQADGCVGISAAQSEPHWPTMLAVLAWRQSNHFQPQIDKALRWMLSFSGATIERSADIGHDTSLQGWPWVGGTHSWIEPTAMCLLALKATGHAEHPRAREAAALLLDRLLPEGGCNYGNTTVLGQPLRAHLEPTGLALAALRDEPDHEGRIERSLRYVEAEISAETTAASLAYAIIGLAAHGRLDCGFHDLLHSAADATRKRGNSLSPRAARLRGVRKRLPLDQTSRKERGDMSIQFAEIAGPPQTSATPVVPPSKFDRRALLLGGGAVALGMLGYNLARDLFGEKSLVFIARGQRYDGALQQTIRDGLLATGLDPATLRGRKVLLKPNMVEPTRKSPQMTTHPAMVLAAADVFRQWDAQVIVGEAAVMSATPRWRLVESGMADVLDSGKLEFADLNYEEVGWAKNAGRASPLEGFYFPQAIVEADLIVTMPKLKTHHWVGMTCSLKNLYGVLPGIKYGWPKNVLHHAGIPQTVFDINA